MPRRIDRVRILDALLGGRSVASFTPSALSSRAHWHWNRDRYLDAFVLFDASARRADATGDASYSVTSRNRAAVALARSGANRAESLRRLRAVLEHYRQHPDDYGDRHWVEWAWTWLIELLTANAPTTFARHFHTAVVDCGALGCPDFPEIMPHIERLAELAQRGGERAICANLVERRRARKGISKALRARLAAQGAWARQRSP